MHARGFWHTFLMEQTYAVSVLSSSIFFSCWPAAIAESISFSWKEWAGAYLSMFCIWILFAAFNFLCSAALWDIVIYGRIRSIRGDEIAQPLKVWLLAFRHANHLLRLHDRVESSSRLPSQMNIEEDVLRVSRGVVSIAVDFLISICHSIRKNSDRQRQIVFRIGAFSGGEPLPA